MRKNFYVIYIIFMVLFLLVGCDNNSNDDKLTQDNVKTTDDKEDSFNITKINDYFYEVGTYNSLDYMFVKNYFENLVIDDKKEEGGGCSCISAMVNDRRLVGRNMDLNITDKCMYFVKTKIQKKYETLGLAYTYRDEIPDYDYVKKHGISEEVKKLLPFMCTDVINKEGLHIETNMRYNEKDDKGKMVFGVEHTNSKVSEKIYMYNLCQYIALNCKSVSEVEEYIKEKVDIYSKNEFWNFCFIISDAKGDSALLEFGDNKFYFTKPNDAGVIAQTNYYINEELGKKEKLKIGVGRYDTLMKNIDSVKNKNDLYKLMKKVQFSSFYLPYEDCMKNHFDPRSEIVGDEKKFTFDYVTKKENEKEIKKLINDESNEYKKLSRQERKKCKNFFESVYTEVVDPKDKVIYVRLFEKDSYFYKITFDGIKKIKDISDFIIK